ncbi:unnamed protein product [Paramecium sonneborni]|uniref:Uncharacterized protein n=1 Tax=Paramecium sonneborni TaxID=65129 RepID=A0A8S1QS68_9CILI|nr:unnamed protein product [Paramecium sonneborni]
MQQFTSPYNVSQQPEEIKKQSTFLNFSLDQEQVAQPKELVNNSQQDDSDLIWSNNQKPEILQTFDFNLLDINQEQNQSLAEQPNQNSNGFNNFWQTQNNNQFNANYPQTTQFSNLLGNFNQNNFALQDLTKNQQDDIIQNQDIQNPIIQNQPKSDDQKIKDEFAYWNQPKVQSESQPSQQDIEDKFNNFSSNSQTGWGDFQIFQFNNKQKEQIEEFINFEQDNNRNYEENGSKLQQSIHNSEQEVIDKQNNNQEEENSDQEKINGNIKILNEYQQENPQKNFDSYEQKQNSLSESQIIQQPLNKTQSFEFPSSIQVPTHSIRGSKEDDKELTYVEQIMELLKPKITEITQNLSNEIINNDCNQNQEAQPKLFQGILDIFQKEKRRVELDLLNQQVQIIKDIVTKYDNKTEQLQEQFIKVREERERERQKSNMSINSIELRKSLDVDQQIEESPIQNIQLQQSPEQQQYTPKTSQDKAYIPFQLIHQTQSKYLNESLISQENKEDDLIKFKTNFVFQRQLLKGLQYQDIQKFRIQCLNEKVILLETEELIVTQNEERNENKKQGYKIQLKFKNKGRKIIQNLIVCLEGKQFKNDVEANPQRIKQQYLSPGETIIQDIRFKYYDQQTVYLNCYLKYSINGNRGYWSQGQQGIQNQEAMYISQMNQYNQNNSYQHNQENKKNYQFIIGRPANKFFTYHYWTVEELNEYKMSYQSEEFELKQLEDLIIYHPWLVKIDQQTLCGKIFLRLDENDYDFVVKVCLRGEKGVIKMNQTDMDKKLCEHLLSFLSFLFVKLY